MDTFDGVACKAYRAKVGISQTELADAAHVSQKTISDFEKGRTSPQKKTIEAIKTALNAKQESLRPSHPNAGKGPRWVTAGDIQSFADTNSKVLQALLPEVIERMIRASLSEIDKIEFRSGDSVSEPGWDGQVNSSTSNLFIPSGLSGWEIGCDKNITTKANDDYDKRKENSLGLPNSTTTYVFVTPRRWRGKARWVSDRNAEGFWKEVLAFDADDLELWLKMVPGVAAWLAREMGKFTANIEHISEFWDNWKDQTTPALNSAIVLAGRSELRDNKIWNWINSESAVLEVHGESIDEAIAFLSAALTTLPKDPSKKHFFRCVIVRDREAFRSIVDERSPMVLVLPESLQDLAIPAAKKGHHVFIPLSKDVVSSTSNSFILPIPDRDEFKNALVGLDIEEERANSLCVDSGRSLPVLQRLIGLTKNPEWATAENATILLPALLIGAWDGNNEHDRDIISRLAKKDYEDIESEYTKWAFSNDAPLRNTGTLWHHTSRLDSWRLLSRNISKLQLERFAEIANEILSEKDPSFNVAANKRWLSTEKIRFSNALREGVLQTFILLATSTAGIGFKANNHPENWVSVQVKKLITNASEERWYSLSSLLPLLSEAAPQVFCGEIEKSLQESHPPIMKLFETSDTDFPFGDNGMQADLLWSLENLAWDPRYLTRVTCILGTLTRMDPFPDSNHANRPENSLKEIFVLWLNNSYASFKQKLAALDKLISLEPTSAWKLVISMIPKGHDISSGTSKMRWREISAPRPPVPTNHFLIEASNELFPRILKLARKNTPRLQELISHYDHFPDDFQKSIVFAISEYCIENTSRSERNSFLSELREIISRHRRFPEADWAMDESEILPLVDLYKKLEPIETVDRDKWLFDSHWPSLMSGERRNDSEVLFETRKTALQEIITDHGLEGIYKLVETCREPIVVGGILAELLPSSMQDWEILEKLLSYDSPKSRAVENFISVRASNSGAEWISSALKKISRTANSEDSISKFFMSLPFAKETWNLLESQSAEIQGRYWKASVPYIMKGEKDEIEYAVRKLIEHGRPKAAFKLCHMDFQIISSKLLVNLLDLLTSSEEEDSWPIDSHDIDDAFSALDSVAELPLSDLAMLEWRYAKILNRVGGDRGSTALHKQLAEDPNIFVDLLQLLYKSTREEPGEIVTRDSISEDKKSELATNAFHVLRQMKTVPGTQTNGKVDFEKLEKWFHDTRTIAEKVDRLEACDVTIGEILAHAPQENENIWPCYSVCEVIESARSNAIERGFSTGIFNKRGIFSRSHKEGGEQEYDLARKYESFANNLTGRFPRTAAILYQVGRGYEDAGRRADDRAIARSLMD